MIRNIRQVVQNSIADSSNHNNALEKLSNVDKGSQNSFMQMNQDGLTPIHMADLKEVDL